MSRPTRLHLALVLVALLPGLLLQGGESLRVCLHDWMDYEDGCQEAVAHLMPSTAPGDDCCAENRDVSQGLDHAAGHECGGCCIEIGSYGAEPSTPPPTADGDTLCPAAPLHHVAVLLPAPPVRRLTPRTVVPARTPPGRAPTPLRI